MSLGIYPVFDRELRESEFNALGEILFANIEELDRIAHSARMSPLTSFTDTRDVPADFDGPPEDLAGILGPWTEWFNPADGRAVCGALAEYIVANSTTAKKLREPVIVVDELKALADILAAAEGEGVKFRLEVI